MKKLAPYIALAAVLTVPAISLHLQHQLAYAAVISAILGAPFAALSIGRRRVSAGMRGIAVILLLSAIIARVYGPAAMTELDVLAFMAAFAGGAGIFRIRFGRWPYERHTQL